SSLVRARTFCPRNEASTQGMAYPPTRRRKMVVCAFSARVVDSRASRKLPLIPFFTIAMTNPSKSVSSSTEISSVSANRPRPLVLVILDGFGERAERDDNAVRLAKTPVLDALYRDYPHGLIGTSGPDVGLPPGQMGNSEVGHLNFGAGRIAMMDISRIDNAVHDGVIGANPVIAMVMAQAKEAAARLHLLGLVSD